MQRFGPVYSMGLTGTNNTEAEPTTSMPKVPNT